jgi:type II secretory pathway pseudopilin PulG
MVIIVVAILGVLAGSFATWLRQRHWRRAARQNEAEARDARAQLAQLQAAMQPQRTPSSPVLLPDLTGTGLGTRDKHGATL